MSDNSTASATESASLGGKLAVPVDIARLRELEAKATPGRIICPGGHDATFIDSAPVMTASFDSSSDSALHIALRNAAPDLMDELERLRKQCANLRAALDAIFDGAEKPETMTVNLDMASRLAESLAERDKLREQVKKPRACDTDEIIRLSNEVTHWRANAKNQAEIRRAIATRPDLKEGAPYVEKIAAERDKLRKENAELRDKLENAKLPVIPMADPALLDEVERLTKERDAWKASHDNQVNLRRTLMDRPNLGDRAKRMQELIAERDSLRRENAELNDRIASEKSTRNAIIEKVEGAE